MGMKHTAEIQNLSDAKEGTDRAKLQEELSKAFKGAQF